MHDRRDRGLLEESAEAALGKGPGTSRMRERRCVLRSQRDRLGRSPARGGMGNATIAVLRAARGDTGPNMVTVRGPHGCKGNTPAVRLIQSEKWRRRADSNR